jgi:hypothetical protein
VNDEIEKILTPEQLTNYKTMQHNRQMGTPPGNPATQPVQKADPAPVKN